MTGTTTVPDGIASVFDKRRSDAESERQALEQQQRDAERVRADDEARQRAEAERIEAEATRRREAALETYRRLVIAMATDQDLELDADAVIEALDALGQTDRDADDAAARLKERINAAGPLKTLGFDSSVAHAGREHWDLFAFDESLSASLTAVIALRDELAKWHDRMAPVETELARIRALPDREFEPRMLNREFDPRTGQCLSVPPNGPAELREYRVADTRAKMVQQLARDHGIADIDAEIDRLKADLVAAEGSLLAAVKAIIADPAEGFDWGTSTAPEATAAPDFA